MRPGGRKQQHIICEVDRLFEVMRHEHHGGAGLLKDTLQLLAHEQRHLVVQR